ncbi:MAG: PAS domain-containing protein, partial [Alphaproteobacteria bacterium]
MPQKYHCNSRQITATVNNILTILFEIQLQSEADLRVHFMVAQMSIPFMKGAKPVRRKLSQTVRSTGVERSFSPDELIVSKTDLKGAITYVNDLFLSLADYSEAEMIGAPHSTIRHPEMPRCIFKLLWDQLQADKEVFAYVKNMSANGDHYWVMAHVTPSFDASGQKVGYHSTRRVPNRQILDGTIIPLYEKLFAEEAKHG